MEMDSKPKRLPGPRDAVAPDGSDVRILLRSFGFVLTGCGDIWRKQDNREEVVQVAPCVCLTIPICTHSLFQSFGYESLAAVGVTMPPWPEDEGEACNVEGKREPTVP